MQRFILSKRNHIAAVSAVLIIIGFASELIFSYHPVALWALAIASVLGVFPIAIQAYQALKVKVISIDVLVTIAVIGAFLLQNFEESAIVTFLFLFGAYLEQRTLHRTRSAIRELTEMAPDRALKKMGNGSFEEVAIESVSVGDLLLVKTGAKVPVDGKVVYGSGYVNEASITGEAVPVGKQGKSPIFAGTIVENGTLTMIAERVGEDTTFGKIIELVEEAQDAKSEAERFIDSFSKYYTPAVLVFAALVWVFSQDVELAITMLVLGCPGALVIGVPVSHVAGIGNGARLGVLLKGSEVIHDFSKIDTMIFDKTGTLTMGKPVVSDVQVYTKNQEVLGYLASVEIESDHPLAQAIVTYLGKQQAYAVEHTQVVPGKGIAATVAGHRVVIGNRSLIHQEKILLPLQIQEDMDRYEQQGDSLVLTAVDGEVAILMGIRDQLRPGVKNDLLMLKRLGVKHMILLSGDHQGTVDHVGRELGLTETHGHMLPQDKADYIRKLQKQNRIVAFVGDGVNDSPSIALAQVGIAMGGGTDVAIETSDVVLMQSDFGRLPHALGLAQATARNMRQNIGIAVGVVLVLLFSLFFSDWMSMSVGMLVHEASILVVILNGMRLLRYRVREI